MGTISQRELRNDSAAVLRAVEAGETHVVTRRGVPVATIGPLGSESDLRCERPARSRPRFSELSRVGVDTSTEKLLADLRGER